MCKIKSLDLYSLASAVSDTHSCLTYPSQKNHWGYHSFTSLEFNPKVLSSWWSPTKKLGEIRAVESLRVVMSLHVVQIKKISKVKHVELCVYLFVYVFDFWLSQDSWDTLHQNESWKIVPSKCHAHNNFNYSFIWIHSQGLNKEYSLLLRISLISAPMGTLTFYTPRN